ncbi:hypothetical protein J4Q44_G00018160 [Coregonus suidteri]|uniref:Ig-like domain-containing protein n=1 Tax=Coregonus suidteri TaxID=861788 RepID=A0AAN8MGD1_9TELE
MSGAGAGSLVLIGCLLRGALCQNGKVLIPSGIKALSGSCVLIPCRFTLESKYESSLTRPCKGTWNRVIVKPVLMAPTRDDLLEKNCTTILNLPYPYPRSYLSQSFFNLECDKSLPFKFPESINIDVKDSPPQPTLTPVTVIVKEGESVILICSAASPCPFLPPTLTWTPRLGDSVKKQNKRRHQTEVTESTLTFTASYLHHGQTMSCTALYKRQDGNSDVSSEKSLTITVLYPPRNTSVSVRPSGSVVEGSSVTLTCISNANPGVLTYNWFRVDGKQFTSAGSRRVVTIQVSADNSQFYCEASNYLGLQKSTVIQLGVPYPPRNTLASVSPSSSVVEGSSVSLTCSSNANPAVGRYNWYRVNGEQVTTVGARRMLSVQVPADDSYFYCEASNDHGTENSSVIQLDGMYPPKKTFASVSPSGSMVEGSSVTLTCRSNANPAVKSYTWYRVNEDQVAPVKATRVLTVQVSPDNTQFYCEARNDLGLQKSAVFQLGVAYKPRNTSVSVSPSGLVVEGSSLTLTCSSNANPAVKTYNWYRVNESKMVPMESRSQSLVLQDISESGLFCCEAQNSYGKEMANIFVYLHHCPSTPTVSVPSIICGVVIVLWILTVIFGVYRYIRLSRGLKSVDDTYATLEISNVTSTYEVIQRKEHGSRGAQRETSGSDM